ncbi:MAG: hypothetical protein L0Y66_10285 [Myxococcaceae bacterium]|nr:hypothetical protein [Myxococcaceae bacterium]
MPSTTFSGSCHCGNLTVQLETTRVASELPVRQCACTFCARHQPRYTSDPQGRVAVRVADEEHLGRYRFGLGLADFLLCRRCGVFVAAFEPGESGEVGRAVINLNVLTEAASFTVPPAHVDYDGEDAAARRARRAKAWTPAMLVLTR